MSDKPQGAIHRVQGTTPLSVTVFILGRAADVSLQYSMYNRGWAIIALSFFGVRETNQSAVRAGPGLYGLGTLPTVLTSFSAAAALRDIYWITTINQYGWPLPQATTNISLNYIAHSIAAICAANTLNASHIPTGGGFFEAALGWKGIVGICLFLAGQLIETVSETTRKKFKANPANKGKIDDTGLWSVVRHPNYLGFTVWRIGYYLATGNNTALIVSTLVAIGGFVGMSIPELGSHMSARYEGHSSLH